MVIVMNVSKGKTGLFFGIAVAISLSIGLIAVPDSYADEGTDETTTSSKEERSFPNLDYQGKKNLKEYWDAVGTYRAEILTMKESFAAFSLTEEEQASINELIDSSQRETNLVELEATKVELSEIVALLESETMPVAVEYNTGTTAASGSYAYPSGNGILTRSGGVNYFNGRKETWYSQRVLPGGGLNIPGRYVAADGTVRDADNYIVVAASDLGYGTVVDTSLGAGKVYDTGCAPGTNDIYVDW